MSQSPSSTPVQRRRNRFHLLVGVWHVSGGTCGTGYIAEEIFRKYNLPHLVSYIKNKRKKDLFFFFLKFVHVKSPQARKDTVHFSVRLPCPSGFMVGIQALTESFPLLINSALLQGHEMGP